MTALSFSVDIHRVKRGNRNSRSNRRRCCGRIDAQKQRKKETRSRQRRSRRICKSLGRNRKKKGKNKAAVYLVGLFLIILVFQSAPTLGTFVVISLTFYALRNEKTSPQGDEAEARTDSDTSPRTLSPSERQELMSRKCSVPGCNTGNFRMTDYCHKHQAHISSNSEPETEEEENWWGDGN